MATPTAEIPTLKQILDALEKQVLVGRTYLDVATGLLEADQVLFEGSLTFFGLTIDGSLELSQMAVARLYDETKRSITIPTMLRRAEMEAGLFQRGTPQEVRRLIADSDKKVEGMEPVLAAIRKRRNEWLAHLVPETIRDPKALEARAKITMPDLKRVLNETENILLDFSSLYDGTIGELKYIGWDDYKTTLESIRRTKCAFIEKYEQAFNIKWEGPRPKDCSPPKDWEML
jgi:hypothetical protein